MIQLTELEQQARLRLCLPLDGLNTLDEIKERVEELSPYVGLFKIGKEAFTQWGREVVELVQGYGSDIFLDLKYKDIPNTAKGACEKAAALGVSIINVHASGGLEMMLKSLEGVIKGTKAGSQRPKLIGVTVLTSIDLARYVHNNLSLIRGLSHLAADTRYTTFTNWAGSFDFVKMIKEGDEGLKAEFENKVKEYELSDLIPQAVLHYADMAKQAGLDGIVCSAQDLSYITKHLPADFDYVTPGIKGPNTAAGTDQVRVMTPYNAIKDGSSTLVVGRAITNAPDRPKAAYDVLKDMARAL